jgi:DNA-binding GntR family transcriptional regulator
MTYKTKGELVLEQIKEMIFSGAIKPGETVSAVEIAEQLGVSRSPVNEAIKRLSDRGLVSILPNVGFEIRTLPDSEALDLVEIKYRLEILAVELLEEKGGAIDVSSLQEPLREIERAIKEQNHFLYSEAAREFHFQLIQLAGSSPLSKLYSISWDYGGNADTRLLMAAENMSVAVDDHKALMESLGEGNCKACKKHLAGHRDKIRKLLNEQIRNES